MTEGEIATFTVEVEGTGNITYQWYYKTSRSGKGTEIDGTTESTYEISSVTTEDEGYYYVVATSTTEEGTVSVTSSAAKLTVTTKPKTNIEITEEPTSQTTIEGKTVTLEVEVTGDGEFTYQWYKTETEDDTENGTLIDEANSSTYEISSVTTEDEGYYYCKITQKIDEEEKTVATQAAKVEVIQKIEITSQPEDITIIEKSTVTFEIEVSQSTGSKITYQWYYSSTADKTEGSKINGETNSSYTITNVATDDEGYYYCIVTQTVGDVTYSIVSSTAHLTVEKANYSITQGETTTYYSALAIAIADAEENDTIVTLQNVEESLSAIVNKNVTLDTGPYIITTENTITVNSEYTFDIIGSGKITSSTATTITNNGILTLDEGVVIANTSSSLYGINNTGTVTMENGTISTTGTGIYNTGIANLNGGSVTVTGSGKYGIYNYQTGEVNIAGATVSSTNYYGIYNYSSSEEDVPTVTVSKGEITGTYGIYNCGASNTYSAVAKITGGTVTGKTYGIYNSGIVSTIQIGDSTEEISVENPSITGGTYGIYINSGWWSFYSGIVQGTTAYFNASPYVRRDDYKVAERTNASYSTATLEQGKTTGWRYDGEGNVTDGIVTLKIGDYVNYDPTDYDGYDADTAYVESTSAENGYGTQTFYLSSYAYGWRVLGVDEDSGEILLVSEDYIGPDSGGASNYDRTYFYMRGQTGYANLESELTRICSLYGEGKYATGARTIKVEDINKMTGYSPVNVATYDTEGTRNGTKYGANTLYEYGNEVEYYWKGDEYPYFKANNGYTTTTNSLTRAHSKFYWYDAIEGWKYLDKSETATEDDGMELITTLTSNYYSYYPNALTTSSTTTAKGINTSSEYYTNMYELLFKNSTNSAINVNYQGTTTGCEYWLGSPSVYTTSNYVIYSALRVYGGGVENVFLFYSNYNSVPTR